MRCPFQQLHRRQEGQTLVEFAIAFPIQILITLGIMQLAMIFVAKQVVNYAAFIAARAELVKIEDKTVFVRLQGACAGCPGALMTLKQGVERRVKELVPEVEAVEAVQ